MLVRDIKNHGLLASVPRSLDVRRFQMVAPCGGGNATRQFFFGTKQSHRNEDGGAYANQQQDRAEEAVQFDPRNGSLEAEPERDVVRGEDEAELNPDDGDPLALDRDVADEHPRGIARGAA